MLLKNKYLLIACGIVVFISIAVISYFFIFKSFLQNKESKSVDERYAGESIITSEEPITDNKISIIMLGMGGAGHPGGTLSDSITVAQINPTSKTINVISIPRDLYVGIPVDYNNEVFQKINMAYAIGIDNTTRYPNKKPEFKGSQGGGNLAKYVAGKNLGFTINYYIAIDFNSFISAINTLGGVTVDNPKYWTDSFYPIKGRELETCGFTPEEINEFHQKYSGFNLEKQYTCRYEKLEFKKGPIELDGETALKYVRSRHSNEFGSDFARGQKAQAVVIAMGKKILSEGLLTTGSSVLKKLSNVVDTDIKLADIKTILEPFGDLSKYEINNIYLTEDNVLSGGSSSSGASILTPKGGIGNSQYIINYVKNQLK